MNKSSLLVSTLASLALLAGACSPQATPTAAPPAATAVPPTSGSLSSSVSSTVSSTVSSAAAASATAAPSPTTGVAGPALVIVKSDAKLGAFLTDKKGLTLYLYTLDTPNKTNCYGDCAHYWPPLLTNGTPFGGPGTDAGHLGTVTRTDGSTQVTYYGWPLYYYLDDLQPGDTGGQDYQSQWYVISPTGQAIKK